MAVRKRVRKDGSTAWVCFFREGGKQSSRTFDTRKEAVAYDAEVKRNRRLGAFRESEPSSMSLGDWAEEWLRTHGGEWSANTYRQRVGVLDRWVERPAKKGRTPLGRVPLRELGRDRVLQWRADILTNSVRVRRPDGEVVDQPISARHVNGIVRVLSSCLGQAVKAGKIPWNPCSTFDDLKESLVEREGPSDDDISRIIDAMPSSGDRVLVALMAYAGLRPAEAVAVKPSDIHDGTLHLSRSAQGGQAVSTKTERPRNIRVRDALAAEIAAHDAGDDWLVTTADGGLIDFEEWRRHVWKPAVRAAGVKSPAKPSRYAVPYELRYSFVRRVLRDERMDLVAAAVETGHSVKVLSDTYTRYIG